MRYIAKRAIILAAGAGTRLLPMSNTTPKPLIKVHGVPMIETMIDGFLQNSINEIYIVVGHLSGQFGYLTEKYKPRITLVDNPNYMNHNNVSSLYFAREFIKDAVICDGDQVLINPKILQPEFEFSGYLSSWADETDEWLQFVDKGDFVQNTSEKGGRNGWQLFSVSYWNEPDGKKLKTHLEELYPKNPKIFWDHIPLFLKKDEYRLRIRRINHGDIIEIDTASELSNYELLQKQKILAKL